LSPARYVKRRPGEKASRVENEGDDDQGHEGEGRVPDDVPYDANIRPLHHAREQRRRGTTEGGPPDPQPARLPDHQDQGGEKDSEEHTSELQSRENLVCRLL